ncbi:unnamed protein product [Rotaria magnacalcarata]|uniref:DUF3108 domain-containing protein n=1 Tax=Rotaria magnacalcarata TaxID=392030 RepID=A0A816P0P1_9BILA|nr:unnamed protein product [Rotaria magnacalcarata]CAF2119625.1 unnamed protein product [Rotaria magnacalcarata]CAF3809342.1 unnamed protein product [Rotaria magnacalcarata]CAF3862825.1 unnamed protein product [Rotaria magnacalcarata]
MIRILILVLVHIILAQTPERQYVIEEDFYQGFKAREFSIYDRTGKNLQYRLESYISFGQSIELVAYPSKKAVGKAYSSKKGGVYQGTLKIRNLETKKWLKGTIVQHYQLLGQHWTISWNETRLSMDSEPASLTTSFHDGNQSDHTCLAKFHMRVQSLIWVNQYDMHIYSNIIPDSIYLLSLAIRDYANQLRRVG